MKTRAYLGVFLASGLALTRLFAQTATPPATTPNANEPITELEAVTISAVPLDQQVLPTVRPVASVMGDDVDVLNIPRSVSTVNSAWMQDRQVTNSMDFGQFSPGVYSPARYGVAATPQIRGDDGQIYVNGQQTLFTPASILPSFNGVEAMDIVKGPGSAVYGPQANAPGGYVNFVTKLPSFDGDHTQVTTTLGDWTSGHSNSNPEFTFDTSGPITNDLAYRVSYLSRYGDAYYQNDPNASQDLYAALTYRATPRLTFQWWGQWYGNAFDAVDGVNRVTQQFIWKGTYVGGSVTAFPDTPPFGSGAIDGSFGVLNPQTAFEAKLPVYDVLTAPGDSARTGRQQTQLISTLDLSDTSKLVNLTYLESANDRQLNQFGYDEYMPVQEMVQDRLEYHDSFDLAGVGNTLITGGDFRYTRVVSYDDYTVEPYFYYDLFKPSTQNVFPAYVADGDTFGGGYQVPGAAGYSAGLSGNSANQNSHLYDSAAFAQDTIALSKHWSAVLGFRDDYLEADDGNPAVIQTLNLATGQVYNPGIWFPANSLYYAAGQANDPSYFASVLFKPTETSTLYLTYNRVDAVQGSYNFGGVNVSQVTTNNVPSGTASDYHDQLEVSLATKSTLYEAGYKESFLHNTLYVDADVYQQTKSELQLGGAPSLVVKTNGFEFETVYQPDKALTFNANFTYQSVTDFGSFFFEETGNYLDGYPVGFIVDGQSGTGNGSPNYGGVSPANGRLKAPGVPEMLANLFVQYELPNGLGAGIGPQIQGNQYANYQGTLHIPAQAEWDGFIYYRRPKWDVQVNIKNLLNSRLLDPIDATFAGDDQIFVRMPISASITFRYRY